MENSDFLFDNFNKYFDRGLAARSKGNFAQAKNDFLSAADALKKLADTSEGEIKEFRQLQIIKILDAIESLPKNSAESQTFIKEDYSQKDQHSHKDESETTWQSISVEDISFDDIAGLDDVKKAAKELIINPLLHDDLYKKHNLKTSGGILMYGLPGTGKTTVAKAIAGEAKVPFFYVKCSDILAKWVGESERNIKNLFEEARKNEAAIIFMDDFEGIGKSRDSTVDPTGAKVMTELLMQMQGIENYSTKMLVIFATNRPWELDSAVIRNGRINSRIHVPLPDCKARKFLIEKEIKANRKEPLNIDSIVLRTEGYSGADIVELCNVVKRQLIDRDILKRQRNEFEDAKITENDFEYALEQVKSSIRKEDVLKLADYEDSSK